MQPLTIFTILKSVEDNLIAQIQENAIMSWKQMNPAVRIIAFGDKPGTAAFCDHLGIYHVEGIKTNEYGLEFVDDAFYKSWELSRSELFCYCNADIILPPYFSNVTMSIDADKFLLVGQRWNIPFTPALRFQSGWWDRLKNESRAKGAMHPPSGMDYFVHKRDSLKLPPLLVGRWFWDNSVLRIARNSGIPIIDITDCAFVIHQNHPMTYSGNDEGSTYNKRFIGGSVLTVADADYRLLPETKGK